MTHPCPLIFLISLLACFFAQAETRTISLSLPDGTIEDTYTSHDDGTFTTLLAWRPAGEDIQILHQQQGTQNEDQQWTLEAGFASQEMIGLCRGSKMGAVELWQIAKQGDTWRMQARANLGPGSSLRTIKMIDAGTVLFQRRNNQEDRLEITGVPLINNPLYRVVTMNGEEYWPYGRAAGGPTAAGKKAPSPTSQAPPQSIPALPIQHAPNTSTPNAQPLNKIEETSSPTTWSVVAVLIVAVVGLLWLLLKKRK